MPKGGKNLPDGTRQSFTVDDYKEALESVGGSMSCAANILHISPQAFRERVRLNPELKEFITGFREGIDNFSITGKHSHTCRQKLAVLDARRDLGAAFSLIENVTGIDSDTIYAWIERDPFFKKQWDKCHQADGDQWIHGVLKDKAISGDMSAIKLYISSQFPERGFGKDNKRDVVVVNQYEGMLDAVTEFVYKRDEHENQT